MALGFPITADAAAQHGQVSPDSTTCEAGYVLITNLEAGNLGIQANGVGNLVTLNAPDTGSCFELLHSFPAPTGGKGYEYQNESGHCLFATENATLTVESACVPGDSQEQFYGYDYGKYGKGWVWENYYWYEYDYPGPYPIVDADGCDEGSYVTVDYNDTCYLWNFPS
jgi:hypothetical protein